MTSIDLATNQLGTYKLQYNATDEANNQASSTRNVFITPSLNDAVLTLKPYGSNNYTSFIWLDATSNSNHNIQFIPSQQDPGVTATDKYGNDVSNLVRIKHEKYVYNESDNTYSAELTYDTSDDSLNTYIQSNVDPSGIFLFDPVQLPNLAQGGSPIQTSDLPTNKTSSELVSFANGYKTYWKVTYILSIPHQSVSLSVNRFIYITDIIAPTFTLDSNLTYTIEKGTALGNLEDGAIDKFDYIDNYFFCTNSNGSGKNQENGLAYDSTRKGFKPDSIVYKDPSGGVQSGIDTNVEGDWTVIHKYKCVFPDGTTPKNYVTRANKPHDDADNFIYGESRTVTIGGDVTNPKIIFKEINESFGTGGSIVTSSDNNYGDSDGNKNYGKITITVPSSGLNSDNHNLAAILGADSSLGNSSCKEVTITDQGNDYSSLTISYKIKNLNGVVVGSSANTEAGNLNRSKIGTDFSDIANITKIAAPTPGELYVIEYTAADPAGNTEIKSRAIYIVDDTDPTITFVANGQPLYGNGLNYANNSGTGSQSVSVDHKTNYSDNLGDTVTREFEANPAFRKAYPRNQPNRVNRLIKEGNEYVLQNME